MNEHAQWALDQFGDAQVGDRRRLARLVGMESEAPAAEGQASSVSVSLTEAGKVMGTPQYMAPEQKNNPTEVDHRADIYSLGVVFYQMLTGELPGKRIEAPSSRMRGIHLDVRLDEVVFAAYGWPADLSDDEILARLLALNLERAAGQNSEGRQDATGAVEAKF